MANIIHIIFIVPKQVFLFSFRIISFFFNVRNCLITANTATLQKQPGFAQDVLQDLSHAQRSFGSSGQLQPQLHPNAPSNNIDSQSTRKMWIESRKTGKSGIPYLRFL
jgi:hypothetical protein